MFAVILAVFQGGILEVHIRKTREAAYDKAVEIARTNTGKEVFDEEGTRRQFETDGEVICGIQRRSVIAYEVDSTE